MRNITFILALTILSTASLADDVLIELKPPEKVWSSADFYISDVVDGRRDSSDIGFALTGMFNKMKSAQFADGLRPALMKYLGALLPADSSKPAVAIKVLALEVSEKSGFTGEYAICQMKMSFYRHLGDSLRYLYTASDYQRRSGLDVTGYHEGHIRKGLENCLTDFMAWKKDSSAATGDTTIARKAPPDTISAKVEKKPRLQNRRIIFGSGYGGANSWSGGLGYIEYSDNAVWCPALISSIHIRNIDYNADEGRYTGKITDMFLSAGVIRKYASGRTGVMLDGTIPFGYESVNMPDGTKTDPKFFIGLCLDQLLIILPSAKGLALMAGPTERIQFNSKAYPWDFGMTLQLGYKW